jgi:hypothetical protein
MGKMLVNEHTKGTTFTDGRFVVITLPEHLDFEDHYEQTATHFHNLGLAARGLFKLRTLDFGGLRHISASAALVLASEVDRWNFRTRKRLRAKTATWHQDIRRLLCQMGYFELLGLDRPPDPDFSKPTVFLPFKRGIVDHRDGGTIAKEMRIEIEATIGKKIKKLPLFDGLSEAITNVSHHAYSPGDAFRQWWLSASFDQSNRRLCVTFYDQGAGIPMTLPHSKYAFLLKLLNLNKDSEKIEAAMEAGRSSTGNAERGKGLQNLLEFAKAYEGGTLAIFSLRGMCRVHARKNGGETILDTRKADFKQSIGGTLIEWSVQIPNAT